MALIASTTLFGLRTAVGPIIGVIINNWKEMLIAALFAIIFYQNTFETRAFFWADTIPYLQSVVEEQAAKLENIIDANAVLTEAINDSNSQIQAWKDVSDALETKNILLAAEVDNLREISKTRIRSILDAPTPQSCEAALVFLRDMVPLLQDAP